MPNGFPATESGVELKLLERIFTPEEAEIALKIRPIPETVESIAERLGTPSLRIQLKDGAWLPWLSLLISGMICGLLWETWNYQAFVINGGHWIYTVPEPLRVFNLHFGKIQRPSRTAYQHIRDWRFDRVFVRGFHE